MQYEKLRLNHILMHCYTIFPKKKGLYMLIKNKIAVLLELIGKRKNIKENTNRPKDVTHLQ